MISGNSTVRDVSVTLTGAAQPAAVAANPYRVLLIVQAPSAHAVTLSFTNPSPSAGATGCITLAANSAPFNFGPFPPNGPINLNGTTSEIAIILEGSST